jgi:23S rRNA pseudouridine1911/1915/1917 synthase
VSCGTDDPLVRALQSSHAFAFAGSGVDITTLAVAEGGSRLDLYVSTARPELSRAAVQRLIDDGQIWVDGIARKASYHLRAGESVTLRVPPPEPATPRAEAIDLDILYEDDNLVAVNKPAGMVVHPAAGHAAGTLVNAILAHCPNLNIGGVERPGIVHRLDSDTSGVIIVAKNDAALRDLQAQWKSRRVHKTYLALVEGHVKPPHGKIDAAIGRDPKHRQKMSVLTRGKTRQAVTVYRTLATLGDWTLVQAEPQTGRTHQIRVHLAFLGFPVASDVIYGSKIPRSSAGKKSSLPGLTRQFLHAWKITFYLPGSGKQVDLTAPLPADLSRTLAALEFDAGILE